MDADKDGPHPLQLLLALVPPPFDPPFVILIIDLSQHPLRGLLERRPEPEGLSEAPLRPLQYPIEAHRTPCHQVVSQ